MAALARFPPPALFVISFVLALRVDGAWPIALGLGAAGDVIGCVVVAGGALLAATCLAMFARRHTTIVPHHRAKQLVTSGAYRFTRNPMYVALATIYLGAALLAHTLWPIVFLVVPIAFLSVITIPVEERILLDAFGHDYRAYAERVRRWL